MLEFIFWASVTLIVFTYAGFPLLLFARSRWFQRPVRSAEITPAVTLLIVAHNESAVIKNRLDNVLALDYPRERLNVLVVSDGSVDGTNEIVAGYEKHGIRLLALPRCGKIASLNAGVAQSSGEILVFSDANSMCTSESLRFLVRPFADPQVGGVGGCQRYIREGSSASSGYGECAYFSFDQKMKEWQSAAGSITGATGALYAIRRELFVPVPGGVADDAVISSGTIARGYRLVYEPRAVAYECVAPSAGSEFRRKVRVMAQGFQSVLAVRELLNPRKHGFHSLQVFSHKILRWMMPWPLFAILLSSFALAHDHAFFALAFYVQASFYVTAALCALLSEKTMKSLHLPRAVTLPFFFCLAYAASLKAQWLTMRGHRWEQWAATPHGLEKVPAPPVRSIPVAPGGVAYIMSRFPKITETFILYEVLAHIRRGDPVHLYPLMQQNEEVSHPEVSAVAPYVHYTPWMSLKILKANWYYLRYKPRAYCAMVGEALRGTFGSANFLFGAIVFLPKSVYLAYEMEVAGTSHVHAHFATHPALAALIIHRLTGIPFSFTAHGHDVHCDMRMLSQKVSAAKFVASISEYNRDLMVAECGEDVRSKIHIIHCGVDTTYFKPIRREHRTAMLRIICVASLIPVKGHENLIRACALLRKRNIDFGCDLVGEGVLRKELEALTVSLGIASNFKFHGPRPRNEVRQLLNDSDLEVLASTPTSDGLREGIPVALMEAMACGLPIVSSDVSGIPELVENGVSGFLTQPGDVEAIAAAIELLARDSGLRERMGAAGRERILRDFDLPTNSANLGALLFPGRAVSQIPDTRAA